MGMAIERIITAENSVSESRAIGHKLDDNDAF
jgi:hypothetical protein